MANTNEQEGFIVRWKKIVPPDSKLRHDYGEGPFPLHREKVGSLSFWVGNTLVSVSKIYVEICLE